MTRVVGGFDWDRANRAKCRAHGVSIEEIESLFEQTVMILPDEPHSSRETRYWAVGRTRGRRHVFLVFTIRESGGERLIRPISARYMHKREVQRFEEENPGL